MSPKNIIAFAVDKMHKYRVMELPTHFNFTQNVVETWARKKPNGLALWWLSADGKEEKQYSFYQIAQHGIRAANFFRKSGIKTEDRVLIASNRIPEWWFSMLGLIRLGAVPVPCTPLLSEREFSYRTQTARITAVVCDKETMDKVSGFAGIRILIDDDEEGWLNFSKGCDRESSSDQDTITHGSAPGILYFTSATTGEPKMVLHTQISYGLAHQTTGKYWLDLRDNDIHWNVSDVGWGKAAWSSFFGPWHQGACIFCRDSRRFCPVSVLDTLANFPITTWCAPPTALRMVIKQDLTRWRFSSLRHCVSAGEPVNPELISAWRNGTGLTIYEAYGQTETVALIGNFRCLQHNVLPGSMGRVAPGFEVGLVDDACNELPDGREGEIAVRVKPNRPMGLFKEYWLNPKATAEQFRGDWYLTGDRAIRDKDGYYWFVGRKDDVIKSSGYRIGPFEVESALLEHPAVVETGVVGVPDPLRGQIVKAYIVLRQGVESSESLKHELQQHCKKVASPYKYTREIEFVPDLPKTTSGKIRRVDLRARAAAQTNDQSAG